MLLWQIPTAWLGALAAVLTQLLLVPRGIAAMRTCWVCCGRCWALDRHPVALPHLLLQGQLQERQQQQQQQARLRMCR